MAVEKIVIPDFGDVQQITVVEIFVGPGDSVEQEDSIIALESEKAVMDIPSPLSGTIKEMLVKEDDVVSSGDVIALIEIAGGEEIVETEASEELEDKVVADETTQSKEATDSLLDAQQKDDAGKKFHATPSIRTFAREQSVPLGGIVGTGPKGRILKEDVLAQMSQRSHTISPVEHGLSSEAEQAPLEDFSKYGEVEDVPLGRIQKISGPHLHRSWVGIPHVTHFDEADITEMERFRKSLNKDLGDEGISYSPLVFVVRAVAACLKTFPSFNCSIKLDGSGVVLKKYYHIGIAVDTKDGLVVPVIKDADKLGFSDISEELARLSGNARNGKLAIPDIQGASFTISSLGGIGGTGFTPIINSPQVAILGLSRSYMKPVWDGQQFVPRLTLPFSVSYDHRIIDGAEAARFCRALSLNLEDLKRAFI